MRKNNKKETGICAGSTGKKPVDWDPEQQVAGHFLTRETVRVHPSRKYDKVTAVVNYLFIAGGKTDMPKNTMALTYTLNDALDFMKGKSTVMNKALARYGRTTLQTELSKRLRNKEK